MKNREKNNKRMKYRVMAILMVIAMLVCTVSVSAYEYQETENGAGGYSEEEYAEGYAEAGYGDTDYSEAGYADADYADQEYAAAEDEYADYQAYEQVQEPAVMTEEEFAQICIEKKDQSEKLAAMPGYSADDTWAFYIYMVASNLESHDMDELSDLTNKLIKNEVEAIQSERAKDKDETLNRIASEIYENGSDFPKRFYTPVMHYSSESYGIAEIDPDLIGMATKNIQEMVKAEYGENVKIVIQTGGAKRWQYAKINPNRSQRFLIDENGFSEISSEPVVNMADSDTIADFLTYCTDNYGADHEVVIFWDHGSGYQGYGYDEIYGKMLSLPEIRAGLEKAFGAPTEEPKLEAIGFDACLMASLEVADHMSGYAKYLYASEEIEPGLGWDYHRIMDALHENPEMNGAQLGKVIADTYLLFNTEVNVDTRDYKGMTFSVMDLVKADEVTDAYAAFAEAALKNVCENSSELAVISRAASRSIAYGQEVYKIYSMFDLGMFMNELPEKYSDEAAAVKAALDEAVLYNRSTYILEGSTGLAVYYPLYSENPDALFESIKYIDDISASKDISALYYYKLAGCMNEQYKQYLAEKGFNIPEAIDFSVLNRLAGTDVECDGTGNFSLQLDPEMMAVTQDVKFSLASYDAETGNVIYYGDDAFAKLDEDGNASTFFDGRWITFGGVPLQLEIVSISDENVVYSSPIVYRGMNAYILSSYSAQEDMVTFMGICLESGLSLPGRHVYGLSEGDEVTIIKDEGNVYSVTKTYAMDTVIIDENTSMGLEPLDDGFYYEYIKVKDLRDDEYYSKIMGFTMTEGTMHDQFVDETLEYYDKDESYD
ncbi:MAG: hypothetical protein HUJ76_05190 [Parasporobacterium sp.]|nr:hypothetical protein [Parasporobacterium sp.]